MFYKRELKISCANGKIVKMKEQILDPLRSTEIVDEIREEVSGMFLKKFLI